MKKLLFIFALIIAVCLSLERANAYTYESDFDPKVILTYGLVAPVEQVAPDVFLLSLAKDAEPKFILACVQISRGIVVIVAYAYFDRDMNLKHFYLYHGNYKKGIPNPEVETDLRRRLYKLHKLSGV